MGGRAPPVTGVDFRTMRVLLAEDDGTSRKLVQTTLEQAGHSVVLTRDGIEAQEYLLKGHPLDALILDWMMPRMDGIELARWVRNTMSPPPPILFLSAIDSPDGIRYALEMGADDYLIKPVLPYEILRRLETLQSRLVQPLPLSKMREAPVLDHQEVGATPAPRPVAPVSSGGIRSGTHTVEDIGVGIVAAAGGPKALISLFTALPTGLPASFFVVLHGPTWMTEHLSSSLERQTGFRTRLIGDGRERRVGVIHLATQGQQVGIGGAAPIRFLLTDDPAENFVRPSADYLFRHLARVYGSASLAVVLTGMGRDGALGCQAIRKTGGRVLVQDPEDAEVVSMPQTAIDLGVGGEVHSVAELSRELESAIKDLARKHGI